MDLQTTKLDVMQKIMEVSNTSLLNKMDLEKEMVVGYTVEGVPLIRGKYNLRPEKAEEQLISGEFVTQEEFESEAENR